MKYLNGVPTDVNGAIPVVSQSTAAVNGTLSDNIFPVDDEGRLVLSGLNSAIGGNTVIGGSLSLVQTHDGMTLVYGGATNINITVPSGLSSAFAIAIIQNGTGTITFVPSGTTINTKTTLVSSAQYTVATLIATSTNTFVLSGV